MHSVFCLVAESSVLSSAQAAPDAVSEVRLSESGKDGYDTYRIPSIIKAKNGTLLAFCEAREDGRSDTGNIDLVMKRSTDSGISWSEQIVLWDDDNNTCGNPCPVVDQASGIISLLLTWNSDKVHERNIATGFGQDSRKVFLTTSADHGQTWSEPTKITSTTKRESWSGYATGLGAGIQIQLGPHAGRLVIPCDHKEPRNGNTDDFSHVIYSDDTGITWQLGGRSPQPKTNECELVELTDGRLMLNMRNYRAGAKVRQVCFSNDGGTSWSGQRQDEILIEPICQASIRRIKWPEASQRRFANTSQQETILGQQIHQAHVRPATARVLQTASRVKRKPVARCTESSPN